MERKKGIMMSYHAPDRGYIWLDPSVNMFKNFEDGIWKPVATNITYSKVEQLIVEQQKINAKLDTFATKFSELDIKIANITSDVQNISNTIGDVNALRTSEKIIVDAINEVYKMITGSNSIDVTDLLEGRSMTTSIDKLAESHLYAQGSPSEIEVHIIKHPRGYYLYWDTADSYVAEDSDHGVVTRQYMTIIQYRDTVQPQLDSLRTIRIGLSDFEIDDITANIDSKQDKINDLPTIRQGAEDGAEALPITKKNEKAVTALSEVAKKAIRFTDIDSFIEGSGIYAIKTNEQEDLFSAAFVFVFTEPVRGTVHQRMISTMADPNKNYDVWVTGLTAKTWERVSYNYGQSWEAWQLVGDNLTDAPLDGKSYSRKDGNWVDVIGDTAQLEEMLGEPKVADALLEFAKALMEEEIGVIPTIQKAVSQTLEKTIEDVEYNGSEARLVNNKGALIASIDAAVPTDDNYMGGSAGLMTAEDKHELDYISAHMGYLPALETQAKDDLVSAINELNAKLNALLN